jgi:aerobic C4-dicarboxylate transport protein
MKKVGRVGGKALLYFEVVSTIALVIGLVVANVLQPGAGFNADPASLDAAAVSSYAKVAASQSTVDFLLHIIPRTFFDAFTGSGDLLQVLFIAVLFGYAMTHMGKEGNVVHAVIETSSHVFFRMMNALMMLAPIGAGGAMAFTIGRYGVEALRPLAFLMGSFYLTCLLFVCVVLGSIAALTGFNIFRFLAYIKEELLTVLGTSSSESALVPLMQKLERLGCSKSVVGLVVPAGYSFNLDGTNIYLTMAALFVAQAKEPVPGVVIGSSPYGSPNPTFRYGLSAWLECATPASGCAVISSAGLYGFTPWVDRTSRYYATIAMEQLDGQATVFSVRLQQAVQPFIRAALQSN